MPSRSEVHLCPLPPIHCDILESVYTRAPAPLDGLPPRHPDQFNPFYSQEIASKKDALFNDIRKNKYTSDQISFIDRAYPRMLTHEVLGQTRKYDGVPYYHHPYAMAQEAVRMHLDPTLVIATMLHDVPEDVRMGQFQNSEDWMRHIEDTYADYADKARLMRILRAELKTDSFENLTDKEGVVAYYMNTALGKRAKTYLQTHRGAESIDEKDQTEIATVLYDLNRLISSSFIEQDGAKTFDPSLLTVKILDTWQNLETTGFWGQQLSKGLKAPGTVTKLIRARILTNVAELFGMRQVASEMTERLNKLMNLSDIDHPELVTDQDLIATKPSIISPHVNGLAESLRKSESRWRNRLVQPVAQVPWAEGNGFTGIPLPVIYVTEPTGASPRFNPGEKLSIGEGTSSITGVISEKQTVEDGALRAAFLSALGRETSDYLLRSSGDMTTAEGVTIREGEVIAKIRVSEGKPSIISTLRHQQISSPISPAEVPELGLFHPDVCLYTMSALERSTIPQSLKDKDIDPAMIDLLEFMHSPREFMSDSTSSHDTPYVLIIEGKVFLATNKSDIKTIFEMAQKAGVSKPVAYPIGSDPSQAQPVTQGDSNTLNTLRDAGLLSNSKHMVVIKEAQAVNTG